MISILIRAATEGDAEGIVSVHQLSRASYYGTRLNPSDAARDRLPMWQRMLGERDRASFVACDGDDIVGFLSTHIKVAPRSIELVGLYVLPTHFGTGTGSDLYDRFRQERGAMAATLEVWDANERAKNFYRRRGWQATERTRPGPDEVPFVEWNLPNEE